VRPTDEVLAPEGEPPVGAHLITPRRAYTHHGIYMGGGRVPQYGGLSHGLRRGPVEEVSLLQFAHGREVWIRWEAGRFSRENVTRRARLRLVENRYRLLTNNCEHFCEWCVPGEPRSFQVDELSARYSRPWRSLPKLLDRTPWLGRRSAANDYPEAGCPSPQ
jgi:hypothetical protein